MLIKFAVEIPSKVHFNQNTQVNSINVRISSYPGCLYMVHGEECRIAVNITAGNMQPEYKCEEAYSLLLRVPPAVTRASVGFSAHTL